MGNFSCNRCVQELENKLETDLKYSVNSTQDILNAYSSLQESESISMPISSRPKSSSSKDAVITIQKNWRIYLARKEYRRLKNLSLGSSYFPCSDIFHTISKAFYCNSRKKKKFNYPNGAIYNGETKGGFRDGYGKMTWQDQCFYEGNWSFGYPSGYGKFVFNDKESYEGKWINPFSHPRQSITSSTKSLDSYTDYGDGYVWLWIKEGSLVNPPAKVISNPISKLESLNQKFYSILQVINHSKKNIQTFLETIKHKKHTEIDNGVYYGEIIAGQRHGNGKQIWSNKNWYIGQWNDDNPNGFGKSEWTDGSNYIGFYKNNLKEGVGVYKWFNGNSYMGEWKDNLMHGVGKYTYFDGREYYGEWAQGLMDGFGIFTWKDGRKYEGEWKKGKKHGSGFIINLNGKKSINTWENGRISE